MPKIRLIFFLTLLLFTQLVAREDFGSFEIGAGYREDRLRWNVSSDFDQCPFPIHFRRLRDIDIENRWKDLRSSQVTATARYTNCYNFLFRGYGAFGEIFDGVEKRTLSIDDCELIRTRSDADSGEVYDVSGGIGYTFHFLCDRSTISPIVGYSYHQQHVKMNRLLLTRNRLGINCPDDNLQTNYHARWKGPFVGFEFTFWMLCNMQLYGGAEFNWTQFRGKGHRHFRILLLDRIKQRGDDGRGLVYHLGIRYEFTPRFMMSILGNLQCWRVWSGSEHAFRRNRNHRRLESELHIVHWHSWSVSGTLGWFY